MSLSALEKDVLNVFSLVESSAAALVAANNPKYASIISTVSTLSANATAALGVPSITSTLPTDLVTSVAPTVAAVNTLTSKTSTATQKAAALTTALSSVEVIGEDIWGFVTSFFTKSPAPTTATAPTTST